MKIDTKVTDIFNILNKLTPEKIIFLKADDNFQLLTGVILSAQTTDRQVNEILPDIFSKYPNPEALSKAGLEDIKRIIHSLGFFNVKAANIIKTAEAVHKTHNDIVPADMNELLALAGVGRKSANVIRGACFGLPAIIVDTHFSRTVQRLELTAEKKPDRIEKDLSLKIPPEIQYKFSMLLNKLGRTFCTARSPACSDCPLRELCEWKD